MTEYPKAIKFKYSWRKYQLRVLEELQEHLKDGHLHVVAPPGSGKTVLGLEVAIRINKPTLILAPTRAIRNQWIQRFCELFLQTDTVPDWISRDIRNPKFFTVVTYQGLHAACNDQDAPELGSNLELILKGLKSQKIGTIVVDEAHHLKNEWWHTLTHIKKKLKPTVVGLTATPPYDVTPTEWQRYMDLNGPIDAEISVPELVIEGDLCPHQDYIYFTNPSQKERQFIADYRDGMLKLFKEVSSDKIVLQAVQNHPIWLNPMDDLDWVYNNLKYYSACLIFLHANQIPIPELHMEIIGGKDFKIPRLDYEWLEILLEFYLYQEKVHFNAFEEHRNMLENRLQRHGATERKRVNFSQNSRVRQYLTSSISKMDAITAIVDFEYERLGRNLRLVVLSDFIRKEFYVSTDHNTLELNKIGVIPIFEKLRRENKNNKKIAVLTGSMIIIPASTYAAFQTTAAKYDIYDNAASPVPFDTNYLLINQTEGLKQDIVHIVTQLFQTGEIEVLLGTKSLLGEGWDAPAINALILASFVGSFVLSNQMRGRAIRAQQGNKDKTANIWHLVCADSTSATGGDDLKLLKRRFKSFVGVSLRQEPEIENGIGRFDLPENINNVGEISRKNAEMLLFAADRENLRQRWNDALSKGVNLVEEIKIPFAEEQDYQRVKSLYLNKTIRNVLATVGAAWLSFGLDNVQGFFRALKNMQSLKDFYIYMASLSAVGMLLFGRNTVRSLRLYLKYRDISKDLNQVSYALLNGLLKAHIIRTDRNEVRVETQVDRSGSIYCHLEGGTTYDKSIFINALQEIIAPINNPRYVIVRKNKFAFFVKQEDYNAVPELLARKKEFAEYFSNQWEAHVGNCDLIFTRTITGRKLILKARAKSLAAQLDENVLQVSKWR
ncbi:DEAD/DEAH box helicase family protein [Sphingobacterium multivorum]|nr:DEAD/DEAH box helicase family protein [Sphingobacterium multivorum]QQT32688.1 DEAD/DEAH box helicase family protein [Sphingobacterium multivorum]